MQLCNRIVGLVGLSALGIVGCGGSPEVSRRGVSDAGSAGDGGGESAIGGTRSRTNELGSGGTTTAVGGTGGVATGTSPSDPCVVANCGVGQACVVTAGVAGCVDRSCSELSCSPTQECQAAAGGGNVCVSIACTTDAQCPEARFCNGTICVDDVCVAESRECVDTQLLMCGSNGGGKTSPYTCGSTAYFASTCSSAKANAGCNCQDDWDCPAYTACESGLCEGTGAAPTCTLPPAKFEDVLPTKEFQWGGVNRATPSAVDGTGAVSPFQWSNQVASTPIVANLDDDTGDGIIDELDFPEIIFVTHTGTDPDANGVVRAIHGGGPNKGRDYFATCGNPLTTAGAHWLKGQAVVQDCNPGAGNAESQADALVRPGSTVAVGDINNDGLPEIVVVLESASFMILDNKGASVLKSATGLWRTDIQQWKYPGPAIVNLDLTGYAEVVIGNRVISFKSDTNGKLAIDKVYAGTGSEGTQHQAGNNNDYHNGPIVCPADLIPGRAGIEFVAGTTLYALPVAPNAACGATYNALCTLDSLWDAQAVNATLTYPIANAQREGFCAVADVLGSNAAGAPGPLNALDQKPEVVVIANGYLLILDSATGTVLRKQNLQDPASAATYDCVDGTANCVVGGAPNIDDFDGDGFPEIATAMRDSYQVVDLQTADPAHCPAWDTALPETGALPAGNVARTPGGICKSNADCTNSGTVCNVQSGQCVCLHNGWKRTTKDASSGVTSSSVFDFNGDGAAEVVYADECYFRVYDGTGGGVYLQLPALNRTLIDNPVVADVDNDGNAEIVIVQNNAQDQCGRATLNQWPTGTVVNAALPNGIEVFGDASDTWVSARRIWNQQAYHVTNVLESGAIPSHEPESWKPWNGRLYNTYRSQPRNYGVAPDLSPTGVQVFSPNVACGQLSNEIQITALIANQGDLRVGPGVVVEFYGVWADGTEAALSDATSVPLTVAVSKSLEPGSSLLTPAVTYTAGNAGMPAGLPQSIRVVVDKANQALECVESNNSITGTIEPGVALADLRLEVTKAAGCAPAKVDFTLHNDGAISVSSVVVNLYAGDPSSGGALLGQTTVAGPIAAGQSAIGQITVPNVSRDIVVWGVADPSDLVVECNDANNIDQGPSLSCGIVAPT